MQERVNILQVKSAVSDKKRTEYVVKSVPGTVRVNNNMPIYIDFILNLTSSRERDELWEVAVKFPLLH